MLYLEIKIQIVLYTQSIVSDVEDESFLNKLTGQKRQGGRSLEKIKNWVKSRCSKVATMLLVLFTLYSIQRTCRTTNTPNTQINGMNTKRITENVWREVTNQSNTPTLTHIYTYIYVNQVEDVVPADHRENGYHNRSLAYYMRSKRRNL